MSRKCLINWKLDAKKSVAKILDIFYIIPKYQ